MRQLQQKTTAVVLLLLLVASIGPRQLIYAQDSQQPAPGSLRFVIGNTINYVRVIQSVAKDGRVQAAVPLEGRATTYGLYPTEGIYLGFFAPSSRNLDGARIGRVQVVEVRKGGELTLQVGSGAVGMLQTGESVTLIRPVGSLTQEMEQLPDIAELESTAAPEESLRSQSLENLKQIGLALHNYHDTYQVFPPAIVLGPDGQPWHSWRVLLLPFLGQQPLYEAYRFDEPWNGPHNSKLLAQMPKVYSDPVHGENKEYFTHYAAAVGEGNHQAPRVGKGMAFSPEGAQYDGKNIASLVRDQKSHRRIGDFIDGTSNTIVVGSVSPDRRIPWLKPEDIIISLKDDVPKIGSKEGFSAPYRRENGTGGLFVFGDGSVRELTTSTSVELLRAMLTIDGGDLLQDRSGGTPFVPNLTVIYIEKTAAGTIARLAKEPAQSPGGRKPASSVQPR